MLRRISSSRVLLTGCVLGIVGLLAGCSGRGGGPGALGGASSPVAAPVDFQVGGTLTGLDEGKSLVAANVDAGGQPLQSVTLVRNGAFSIPVRAGTYDVRVLNQPSGQICTVQNGSGFATGNVDSIRVECRTDSGPPLPSAPTLSIGYSIKTFNFSWSASSPAATSYRLFEDPDGSGPLPVAQIGGTLTGNTYTQVITGLLHTRVNATYSVQGCNADGCGPLSAALTPDLAKAVGYFKASNTEADDFFGASAALSADGSTLAVGAVEEDSNASGINGDQTDNSERQSGAVYVFIRTGITWTQQAYVKASNAGGFDQFGFSLALSDDGSTLAVGSRTEASNATGVDGNQSNNSSNGSGAVYVFERTAGTWAQQVYLKASNTRTNGAEFGRSVALSGDGNTLAVGAFAEDSPSTGIDGDQAATGAAAAGAVYVFTRNGSKWSQQAYVKASNTDASDGFGTDLALSTDGNTLAVGAPGESSGAAGVNGNQLDNSVSNAGAVYVFSRSGIVWGQQAYIKASNPGANNNFGKSLALSGDGNTLAAGAPGETGTATGVNGPQTSGATNSGAAYVFVRSGSSWAQQAYVKASNTSNSAQFGHHLALTGNGDTLAVSALGDGSNATGINGDQSNTSALGSGAVYIFNRSAGNWAQQAYVKAPNTDRGDAFGFSLALSGDGTAMFVGALREGSSATGIGGDQSNNSALLSGAVYLY